MGMVKRGINKNTEVGCAKFVVEAGFCKLHRSNGTAGILVPLNYLYPACPNWIAAANALIPLPISR